MLWQRSVHLILISIFGLFSVPAFSSTWETWDSEDRMTGAKSVYASSPDVSVRLTSLPMSVESSIVVGCAQGDFWAYFWFSSMPNLIGGDFVGTNGDQRHILRTRLGDNLTTVAVEQSPGSDLLYMVDFPSLHNSFRNVGSVLIELPWYMENQLYFEYSTQGYGQAIADLQSRCQ
jgi:hypothetical protein